VDDVGLRNEVCRRKPSDSATVLMSSSGPISSETSRCVYTYAALRVAAQRSAACTELVTAALRCALLPVAFTNNVIGYSAHLLAC